MYKTQKLFWSQAFPVRFPSPCSWAAGRLRQLGGLEQQRAPPSGGKGWAYLFLRCQRRNPLAEAEGKAEIQAPTPVSPGAKPCPALPREAGACCPSVGRDWLAVPMKELVLANFLTQCLSKVVATEA